MSTLNRQDKKWWDCYELFVVNNVVLMLITPVIAVKWLQRNTENRKSKANKITEYKRAIKAGGWMVNGEPIIFDWNGVLRNGQNRLMAIVESGLGIESYVVFDVDPASFETMDTGTKRTAGDALHIRGENNYVLLAGAVKALIKYRSGNLSNSFIPNFEVSRFIEAHPDVRNDVAWVRSRSKSDVFIKPSTLAACKYLCRWADSEKHEEFWNQFFSGTGLYDGSPVLALRQKLIHTMGDRKTLNSEDLIYLISVAWRKFVEGQLLRIVKLPASMRDRQFPSFGQAEECLG